MAQPQGFDQGDPITLTWGFVNDGLLINDSNFGNTTSNLRAFMNGIYGNISTWQPLFASTFDRWASISGLSYVYQSTDDNAAWNGSAGVAGVRADLRIAGKVFTGAGSGPVLAYNFFPNNGNMVIDTGDTYYNTTSGNSIRLRNVVAHEHGHGMGQNHLDSNDSAFLMEPGIDTSFDGPQYHDILVAQRGYGDFHEKSFAGLGNDVAARATSLGLIGDGNSVSVGDSARTFVVAPNETDFVSIDDTTDIDFWSFSIAQEGTVDILLEALGFNYQGSPQNQGGATPFDASQRSNLTLSLFDTNGTSLLATSNFTGLGGDEMFAGFSLGAGGTYFVRVTGVNNADLSVLDTQFYGLTVSYLAIPEPGSGALCAAIALALVVRRRRS